MKRRLTQWCLFAGLTCAVLIAWLLVFQRSATSVADSLMTPWMTFCEMITPASWQTMGNVLLGLLWLVSGIAVFSMFVGATCVASLAVIDRLRTRAH